MIRNSTSVPGKAVAFGSSWVKQGELKGSHTKHVLTQDKSNPKKALVAISPCQIHGEELLYTASDNYHLILENHFRPILTDASWEGDTENINEWCFSFIQALNIMKHWSKPPKCLGKAKTSFHFKSIWKHNHGSHWQPWLLDCRPKTTSATGRRRQERLPASTTFLPGTAGGLRSLSYWSMKWEPDLANTNSPPLPPFREHPFSILAEETALNHPKNWC